MSADAWFEYSTGDENHKELWITLEQGYFSAHIRVDTAPYEVRIVERPFSAITFLMYSHVSLARTRAAAHQLLTIAVPRATSEIELVK